ncbi:MAG: NUDIX domain-containing protein [Pseudomonadota bacterium]
MVLPPNLGPRLAARALIVESDRLLLVNAYPGGHSDLWCAPGGGVERHSPIPDNLVREIHEELGVTIAVGPMVAINEYHSREKDFHQVELFFRATIVEGSIDQGWRDPSGVVSTRRYFAPEDAGEIRFKPDSLFDFAFGTGDVSYDALEPLVR